MAGRERKNELSQLSAPEKEQRHVKKIKKKIISSLQFELYQTAQRLF